MVGWAVVETRDDDHWQALPSVYYPGRHRALRHNSPTYSVEADTSQLRRYLARGVRTSPCIHVLWPRVKVFA
jgi:IS1 family transposase